MWGARLLWLLRDGDDDDYYGPGQDADAIEDAEDDMIYGMQDDFDAAAVEAAVRLARARGCRQPCVRS